MNIHRPEYWFRDPRAAYGARKISISAILRQVGTRISAGFSRNAIQRAGDENTLLWQPADQRHQWMARAAVRTGAELSGRNKGDRGLRQD